MQLDVDSGVYVETGESSEISELQEEVTEVTSPAGNVVHNQKGTAGDKFELKAPRSGMYKFCFHNPYSAPETVSFYIHVGHIPSEHNIAKDEKHWSLYGRAEVFEST